MDQKRQQTTVEWSGIHIEITLTQYWLSGAAHHLELRADEPLSVTATGYRSHFFPADEEMDLGMVTQWVMNWLEEAAQSKEWKKRLEQQRQGDLFDL